MRTLDPIQPEQPPEQVSALLRAQGFVLVDSASVRAWLGPAATQDAALRASWARLPPDLYLKDQGRYRYRRHASARVEPDTEQVHLAPHRPHWQPTTYNALHGGIRRWFEPIEPAVWQHAALQRLLVVLGRVFSQAEQPHVVPQWFVEAHQFRIDARREVGKPTPEGAHRDGVDFVAVVLMERQGVAGGETAVRSASGALLMQTTLEHSWTALLMDDRRVNHETTPIVGTAEVAHRDTLVLTYRAQGFMDPEETTIAIR